MISVHDLEVRVGARTLLTPTTFTVGMGDRIGLVGRNGAGKTTLTRILAGETPSAGGKRQREGAHRLPAPGPAHRRPRRARDRPHPVVPRPRLSRAQDVGNRGRDGLRGRGHTRPGDRAVPRDRGALSRGGRIRGRERGGADRSEPRDRRRDAPPADRDALGGPATPRRARAHPLRQLRDPPARRADEPPRRGLHRVAPRVPSHVHGRPRRHLPRRRTPARVREQDLSPRRQPRRARPVRARMGRLPQAARAGRAPASPRARQRRAQGRGAHRAGEQDAGQGNEGHRSAGHARRAEKLVGIARRGAARGSRRRAPLPEARAVRQDAAPGVRAQQVVRLARGLHRRRPRHRQGLAGGRAWPERGGEDDAAEAPRRRRGDRHRPRRARAWTQARVLRPGARDASTRTRRCSKT